MKTWPAALITAMGQEVSTIAACLKITLKSAEVLRFTDHSANIVIAGDGTYSASEGIVPTAIQETRSVLPGTMEITTFITDPATDVDEIRTGKYDGATVEAFWVDYTDVTKGKAYIFKNWTIGNVRIRDRTVTLEINSLSALLQNQVAEVYTETCRATFGDARCGIPLVTYQITGTVLSVGTNTRRVFRKTSGGTDVWSYGKCEWTAHSGNRNVGFVEQIESYAPATGEIVLYRPMPYSITVGDPFRLTQGCDKTLITCHTRFNNVPNFRGEPFIPKGDSIPMKYGRSRNRNLWLR